MQNKEVIDKLKKLQDILAQKYELEAKIKELPKSLEGREESIERFKKEFIEKNAEYEAQKAKIGKLKVDLQEAEASRESGEKGMDSITTHREYEALDKQISEATEREQNIRKDLQKEEKILAELSETIKDNESLIASSEADINEAKENLKKEIDGYKKELEKLKKKEDSITPGIDAEIIFKFERIIQRNSKGIVAVKGIVCDGCHMILPAQFANEVHNDEKILFCPYCSRILYYEEDDENTSNYFQMEDAGSLADFDEEDAEDQDLLGEDMEGEEEDSENSMGYDD